MAELTESLGSFPSQSDNHLRLYRLVSISLFSAFAAVGLIFLMIPVDVILFFNTLSRHLGMVEISVDGGGFYLILAVGYMYVVSYLAWRMFRFPSESQALQVLIHAKTASSMLSFLFFMVVHPSLIFAANGVIDGTIAAALIVIRLKWKGLWH